MSGCENCALCGESAACSCVHCAQISYCGAQHQAEHWPQHKLTCKPFRVEKSELYGRYLVASKDIKQGELIMKELPIIIGPRMDSVPICLGCYKQVSTEPNLCSSCLQAPVCDQQCETNRGHTREECEVFAEITNHIKHWSLINNLQLVMLLRCFLLKDRQRDVWEELIQLESHVEDRRSTSIWEHQQEHIVEFLKAANYITTDEECELLHKLCGTLDVNCFELRGPNPAIMTHSGRQGERLRGIYLRPALMSHDCVANTHLSVDDNYLMTIHASLPIPAGQTIYFNYTSSLENTRDRREHLKIGKYFDCKCKRCSDPTELGTYMGSIICSRCHDGFVSLDNTNNNGLWVCDKCSHTYSPKLIKATITRAWTETEEADNTDCKVLEQLLKKFARTFPPTNAVMVEVKQNLVALYRDSILRERNPSRKLLERKLELCQDLLRVLKIIEPGISRLKGITHYELQIPMVLLANREYDAGEIDSKELLTRLTTAEEHLREAVTMLLYEPSNSPEGSLLKIAMDELRSLRDNMQDVKLLNECDDERSSTNKKKLYGRRPKK